MEKFLLIFFFNEIKDENQYDTELGQIQSILEYIGRGEENKIPPAKFKQLKRDKKDKIVDYEIKTRNLRVYLMKDETLGKLVVLGGKKKTQKKDIKKLRSIKEEYKKSK